MHQLNLFGESKTLVSIDPRKNRFRFYFVSLTKQETSYSIERRWGRIVKISRIMPIHQIPLTGTGKMHYRILEDQMKVLHV